ncbi:hypothetical protein [Kutzneria kofuensis]|uniref:Uncharacterized protein n=1 Tax=Kutzneria kofuensis TaxID=103725 RepID=A0A7W9NH31_9PSEU|nr:hypothetical protein [Kutzneria kofuensis]MBB5892149.1 hypothetical protein [Kutzneria kofuensis]
MSTTDDTTSTSTPDATTLDPAMLDEVEQALHAAAQDGGGDTTDGGIPHAEDHPGAVALADVEGGVAHPNGGIPHAETTKPGGGVAHPNGGIPHAEIVRP